MVLQLLPAQVIGGQLYRVPPISTDEWEEKKILFDGKTGRAWPQQAQISAGARATRKSVLKQFWTSLVKDECDLINAVATKAELSYAMHVVDRIGGWRLGGRRNL